MHNQRIVAGLMSQHKNRPIYSAWDVPREPSNQFPISYGRVFMSYKNWIAPFGLRTPLRLYRLLRDWIGDTRTPFSGFLEAIPILDKGSPVVQSYKGWVGYGWASACNRIWGCLKNWLFLLIRKSQIFWFFLFNQKF